MKKLLFLVFTFILSFTVEAQVNIAGYITPFGTASYPTHIDSLGMGGYMSVFSEADRNLIPLLRRKSGMMVHVKSTNLIYTLTTDITNSGWVLFSPYNFISSLTTIGTGGAASLINGVLNIPLYTGGGGADGNNFTLGVNFDKNTEQLTTQRSGLSDLVTDFSATWPKINRFNDSVLALRNTFSLYAPLAHTHVIADIAGLTIALSGKENTLPLGNTNQYFRGDKTLGTFQNGNGITWDGAKFNSGGDFASNILFNGTTPSSTFSVSTPNAPLYLTSSFAEYKTTGNLFLQSRTDGNRFSFMRLNNLQNERRVYYNDFSTQWYQNIIKEDSGMYIYAENYYKGVSEYLFHPSEYRASVGTPQNVFFSHQVNRFGMFYTRGLPEDVTYHAFGGTNAAVEDTLFYIDTLGKVGMGYYAKPGDRLAYFNSLGELRDTSFAGIGGGGGGGSVTSLSYNRATKTITLNQTVGGPQTVTLNDTSYTFENAPSVAGSNKLLYPSNDSTFKIRQLKFNGADTTGSTSDILNVTFDWNTLLNKPATFTPSAHTHAMAEVIGLTTALAGKANLSGGNEFTGGSQTFNQSGVPIVIGSGYNGYETIKWTSNNSEIGLFAGGDIAMLANGALAARFGSINQIHGLAGTGTRMMVALDDGRISTQAIPSGGGGSTVTGMTYNRTTRTITLNQTTGGSQTVVLNDSTFSIKNPNDAYDANNKDFVIKDTDSSIYIRGMNIGNGFDSTGSTPERLWLRVTKESIGLGNVDNTSDLSKPISSATQTALNGKLGVVTTDVTLTGSGTSGSPLKIDTTKIATKYDLTKFDTVFVYTFTTTADNVVNVDTLFMGNNILNVYEVEVAQSKNPLPGIEIYSKIFSAAKPSGTLQVLTVATPYSQTNVTSGNYTLQNVNNNPVLQCIGNAGETIKWTVKVTIRNTHNL